ncbi:FAD-dependent oxidoreductase [Ramlibacter montanisoli]|uniref:FAD-dependent oxidoreductase n=1 Tax=Ramlibacter montanisoli TaxID=2732512 RepID=UPI00209C41C7|nr:hypothetical protein [Ramlibacter montanisoli]
MNPPGPDPDPAGAGLRWLSRDYADLRAGWDGKPIDVLIVGSGYGGAMAAAELAGRQIMEDGVLRPLRVCVLERGNEYAPACSPPACRSCRRTCACTAAGTTRPSGRWTRCWTCAWAPTCARWWATGWAADR